MNNEITFEEILQLDKVQNDAARITFLLNRMLKDAKELLELGVEIKLNEVDCITNDKLFSYV